MIIKTLASSSSGCCYLIESQGEQLLIECGIPLRKIRAALNFDFSKIVGCLVSHEHKDHSKAILSLEAMTTARIYGPASLESYSHQTVRSEIIFYCGAKFAVKPVALKHDVECFGYIVKSGDSVLFYATDTSEINYTIPGLTHLMIEANYSFEKLLESDADKAAKARVSENHLSIESAVNFAKRHKLSLKEVHLLHLSDRHSDERLFKEKMQKALGVPVYVVKKGV